MITRYIFPVRDPVTMVPNDYSKMPFEADISGTAVYFDNCPNGMKIAFDDPSNEQVRVFAGHTIRRPSRFNRLFIFLKSDYVDWTGTKMELMILDGDADVHTFDTRPRFTQGYLGAAPGPAGASQANALSYAQARTPSSIYNSGAQSDAVAHTVAAHNQVGGMFRLLRYMIEVTGNATLAAAGVLTLSFQDVANNPLHNIAHDFYLPNAVPAGVGRYSTGWLDVGPVGLIVPNPGDGATKPLIACKASSALASGSWRAYVALSAE